MPQITHVSAQQTTQQKRATDAYNKVEQIKALRDDKIKKEYGSLVRGLPAMILTDGLGQALAFLLAKAKEETNAHSYAYKHLSSWVCSWAGHANQDLLELVLSKSTSEYRQYTNESLAYLHWLKRFVEAANLKSDEQ
jgi:CRISPR-associated protein Cmr5